MFNRGSFTGSPWPGTASAGTSGTHALTNFLTPPSVGTSLNGFTAADYNGLTQFLEADGVASDYITPTAASGWMLLNADTLFPAPLTQNLSPQFLTDANGVFGVGIDTDGVFIWLLTNAGLQESTPIPCPTGGWHLFQWKISGNNFIYRLDGGPWQTTAYAGVAFGFGGQLINGRNTNIAGPFFDGNIEEIATSKSVFADATFDLVITYINARYGLSI